MSKVNRSIIVLGFSTLGLWYILHELFKSKMNASNIGNTHFSSKVGESSKGIDSSTKSNVSVLENLKSATDQAGSTSKTIQLNTDVHTDKWGYKVLLKEPGDDEPKHVNFYFVDQDEEGIFWLGYDTKLTDYQEFKHFIDNCELDINVPVHFNTDPKAAFLFNLDAIKLLDERGFSVWEYYDSKPDTDPVLSANYFTKVDFISD